MRVLYVDDDRVNAVLFTEICRHVGGVQVETADSGADALAQAAGFAADLLVIDLHLEDGSGLELLPRLRATLGRRVPAYLCTAEEPELAAGAAKDAGFDGLWSKPLDLQRVLAELAGLGAALRT